MSTNLKQVNLDRGWVCRVEAAEGRAGGGLPAVGLEGEGLPLGSADV